MQCADDAQQTDRPTDRPRPTDPDLDLDRGAAGMSLTLKSEVHFTQKALRSLARSLPPSAIILCGWKFLKEVFPTDEIHFCLLCLYAYLICMGAFSRPWSVGQVGPSIYTVGGFPTWSKERQKVIQNKG